MGGGARNLLVREIDEREAVEAVEATVEATVEAVEREAAVGEVDDGMREIVAAGIGGERAEDDGRGAAGDRERGDDGERDATEHHGSSARCASADQRPD